MADRQFIDFRNDSLLDSLKKSETNFTSLFSLAKTVKLTANKTVVTYGEQGTTEGDTILLTVTPRGFDLSNTFYEFVVGGYTSELYPADDTTGDFIWELPDNLEPANEQSIVVTVNAYEGDTTGENQIVAFDSVTITGIQGLFEGVVGADGADGADGTDAKVVKLTANRYVIRYSESGSEGDSITFTAETQGFTGSPYYKFTKVDTSEVLQNTTDNELILDDEDEPQLGEVITVRVDVSETEDGTILATDSVSIYAVQDGSDAIIAFLTNASHVVPASSNGTIESGVIDGSNNITGAGGTFKVFVGATEVTTGNGCVFTESTDALGIASIDPSTGVYTISSVDFDENYSFIEFQVEIPASVAKTQSNVTIEAVYTIAKSNAGVNGLNGQDAVNAVLDLTNDRHSVAADNSGTVTDDYSTAFTYVDFYLNGSEIFRSGGWSYNAQNLIYDTSQVPGENPYTIVYKTIGEDNDVWAINYLLTNCNGGWETYVGPNKFLVTSLNADTGTVTFNVVKNPAGDSPELYSKVMTLTKVKAGANGEDGEDGADAVIYSILPSTNSILRLENGTYTPNTLIFTGQKRIGNGSLTEVDESVENIDFTIGYLNENGAAVSIDTQNNTNPAVINSLVNVTNIDQVTSVEVIMSIDDTIVDRETLPLLNDGTPGPGLVYRGTYDSGTTYYHTDERRDVVQYTSGSVTSYYITNNKQKNNTLGSNWGNPTTENWTTFSNTFDSVATDLLLSKNVGIINTLVMGTLDTSVISDNGEIVPLETTINVNEGVIRHAQIAYDENNSTYTGKGYILNSNGDFYVGNTSGSNLFFDQSAGDLIIKADDFSIGDGTSELKLEIVNVGGFSSSKLSLNYDSDELIGLRAGSVPDASGVETGLIIIKDNVSTTREVKVGIDREYAYNLTLPSVKVTGHYGNSQLWDFGYFNNNIRLYNVWGSTAVANDYGVLYLQQDGFANRGGSVIGWQGDSNPPIVLSANKSMGSRGLFIKNGSTQVVSITGEGNATFNGTVTATTFVDNPSDIRLKENIVNIDNAINKIKQLNGFTFNYNSLGHEIYDLDTEKKYVGLSAQSVLEVLPEAGGVFGTTEETDYHYVKYERLVPLLIEAIKEQQAQIESLQEQINALSGT
jgi:hypothetical protein